MAVVWLLKHAIKRNMLDGDGRTALDLAEGKRNKAGIAALLKQNGCRHGIHRHHH